MSFPRRGDVWFAYAGALGPATRIGTRPVLVISSDVLNASEMPNLLVVPFTTAGQAYATWVPVAPPDGGLRSESFAMCEMLMPARTQFIRRMGQLSANRLNEIQRTLKDVLEIGDP